MRELRKKKGLTQTDMADKMGIKLRQYQRYELEEQALSIDGWIFLADLYDVSLDYLVGRSDVRERR